MSQPTSLFGIEIPADLAEIIDVHRQMFGGFTMMADPAGAAGGDDAGGDDPDAAGGDDAADPDAPGGESGGDDEEDSDEDFDADRALKKIKKLNSENRNLRKAKSDAEARANGTDAKDQEISTLKAENLRIRIGARHGLPDELIDRLKGNTEEEILADAEKLLAIVAGRKPPTQRPKVKLRGGGNPDVEPEETNPRKLAGLVPRQ